ncbi:methyl-accepting chemotaxis protein [Halobacteroides halobius DSM 5150]|uniref:Methyl-accepting chemotaxis protein n=1 Tax=Halobacteroides halobius (strain ATCC 35273 / DSM 5150 / MD-1) TaxID=748449 RepID=L0KAM8_HALHC|nr:methyl-accepting chemotaxis protein [Halobacteroides halobius]AGB42071.1 methyl-accepting chemotaxis protein [Halobacteroides halobius DSM 5150]
MIIFSTIKSKLIAIVLVLALVPIIVLGLLGTNKMKKMITNNFLESTTKEVKQVDKSISLYFKTVKENCELLSTMSQVKQANETITTYMDKTTPEERKLTPLENGGIEAEIYKLYQKFAQSHPNSAYVYMATINGGYIQWPANSVPKNYNPKERPYYKVAMRNKQQVTRTSPYYWSADDAVIVSTVTTIRNNKGKIIGVQGLDVSLKGLTKMVKDIKIGETGYVIMTTNDGTILAHPKNPKLNFKNIKKLGVKKLNNISQIKQDNFTVTMKQKDYLMNVYTSPITGWKFISVIEKSELASKLNSAYKLVLGVISISTVVIIGVAVFVANKFSQPLVAAAKFAKKIANGKLDISSLNVNSQDEVGNLVQQLNHMRNNLRDMVESIIDTVENLSASSEELSAVAEEGSATVQTNNEALEDMASGIQQISASSQEVTSFAQKSNQEIEVGSKNIAETTSNMKEINQEVEEAVGVIKNLDNHSQEIDQIVELIMNIAEQTNLLALNASIEAARASSTTEGSRTRRGKAGQGFAVVADEIRELAEETTKATENIAELSEEIQSKSNAGLEAVNKVKNKAKQGKKTVKKTGEIFRTIKTSMENTVDYVEETSVSAQDLAQNSDQLMNASDDIKNMSEEIANSADELTVRAEELNEVVEKFEI